jgi:hypothetical protein
MKTDGFAFTLAVTALGSRQHGRARLLSQRADGALSCVNWEERTGRPSAAKLQPKRGGSWSNIAKLPELLKKED